MENSEDIKLEKTSLGQSLALTRTKRKLSQKEIADELNLSKEVINALENDESIGSISPTYRRGYQRAYIRFLGLDESELLDDLVSPTTFEGARGNLRPIGKRMSLREGNNKFRFPIKILIPLLLIGLCIVFWPQILSIFTKNNVQQNLQGRTETETELIKTVVIKSANNAKIPLPSGEANQESENTVTLNQKTGKTNSAAGQIKVEKVVVPSELDQSEFSADQDINESDIEIDSSNQSSIQINEPSFASVNPQEMEAKITFVSNGESWLEITDADDARLYRSTLKLDRVTVAGTLPLYVSTGNLQVLRVLSDQGDQQKVDIFGDSKMVAKFYVEKDTEGRLKFTPK